VSAAELRRQPSRKSEGCPSLFYASFHFERLFEKVNGMKMRKWNSDWGLVVLVIVSLTVGTGCQSADQKASNLASVVISGNTPGQIREAAKDVFVKNGYEPARTGPAGLIFEKQGSSMSNFAYGNWMGDAPIWMRVKLNIVPAGEMAYRLQCSAYIIRDRGGATEEELPVSKVHKGRYKKLLEEVAQRFKG
jgi:hypothetical protein